MTSSNVIIEGLLQQLVAQKEAYLESSSRIEALLSQYLALQNGQSLSLPVDSDTRLSPTDAVSQPSSRPSTRATTGDRPTSIRTIRSEPDDDGGLCASELLKTSALDHDGFRKHLQEYPWGSSAFQILRSIIGNEQRMRWPDLFAAEVLPERRQHYSRFEIIEVDTHGMLDVIEDSQNEAGEPCAVYLWNAFNTVNSNARRNCVGRITILREPSPILFAATHFANLDSFDTDELLHYLVDSRSTTPYIDRLFDADPRKQSSYVFSFKYFTLNDDDCKPMEWQKSNRDIESHPGGLSMSYCGAVVALSLQSQPVRKIRNQTRDGVPFGYAYDPWGSWQLLHLQAYADRMSNPGVHNKRHYVNGVEAFMETLLSEYKDAERRLKSVYVEVTKLISSPIDFMFDPQLFDRLFRDDDELTYSQRYFWAYRTCGLIVDTIKSLTDAYETTFTDEVWEGRHKSFWPLLNPESLRNKNYRNRMAVTHGRFRAEIDRLKTLMQDFNNCRAEIVSLRDQLSNAISIADSRKAIQQGHNIRLLTLVSIFFLPLTYVTSVFGMNNMPQDSTFIPFAIATVAICMPFFAFVGLLNGRRSIKSKLKGFQSKGLAMLWTNNWRTRAKMDDAESSMNKSWAR